MFLTIHLFCVISFLGYGIGCLASDHMRREFERYGLPSFRILTGILQILGAIGLLAGLHLPGIGASAAAGLAALMTLGFGVRLKIRDGVLLSLPALLYLGLSAWLCARFLERLLT